MGPSTRRSYRNIRMAKGTVHPPESRSFYDQRTGTHIRQVTTTSALHHHPFFIIPAYDNAMQRLIFISCRTGTPQIFAEERATGELRQLTDRPDISEWSVHPGRNGKAVFFTAGTSGRLETRSGDTGRARTRRFRYHHATGRGDGRRCHGDNLCQPRRSVVGG